MKPGFLVHRGVLLFVLLMLAHAVSADTSTPTEREQELQKQVEQLQAELQKANSTIADLQQQLESNQVASGADTGVSIGADNAAGTANAADVRASSVLAATEGSDTPTFATGLIFGADPSEMSTIQSRNIQSASSVTSLGPAELMLGGVEDTSRLEYLVPSLQYGQSGHDARLAMRGARTNSIGPEAIPVVAIFEDGIYQNTTTESQAVFLDVARVDVLRGPDITTFGQHAYAGAVSVVSNKPNFDGINGYAELENGLPDKTRWRLALNVPFGDSWALRVAGLSESRSGWVDNFYTSTDADDMNDRKVQTMRASLLWQPSDRFSMLLSSRYQDENGTGAAPWGYQQIGGYVDGELKPGHRFAPPGADVDEGPWIISRNFISLAEFETWINTLDINWALGFGDLRWLSNFTSFHGRQAYDSDYSSGGNARFIDFIGWDTSQTSWSSELRLTSNGDSALDWVAGAYFASRSANWGWLEAFSGQPQTPSWSPPGDYTTDTLAAFGQATYSFTDRFSMTGGLRWEQFKRSYKAGDSGKWDNLLWKAALEYGFSDQSMMYGLVSTGFRPGGLNAAAGVNPVYDPEKLTAYELGVKTRFADDRVTMNVAAFFNDFKDVQSQSFLVPTTSESPEAIEYLGNGGSVDAMGVEVELQWRPMQQWNIASHLTYTNAEFGDYTAANLAGLGDIPGHTEGDQLQFKGWRPALTPEWKFGLQTSYTFSMRSYGTLTPYLQTTYVSDYYANDINLEGVRQNSYMQSDVRLIWLSPEASFQLQMYYKNVENEAVLNFAQVYNPAARPEITTLQGNWGSSKTYGILFNYSF